MLLPEIGAGGQASLASAKVAIIGVGAIGGASADALARAGIGHLRLIDRDIVEPTNLQRQCLFTESDADLGVPKAAAAKDRLASINSSIEIRSAIADLTPENAASLLDGIDIIVDGTDNFETRYILNDYTIRQRLPLVCGGAIATRGTVMPILPGLGPCLRCLFPEMPSVHETCDTAGVLGPIVQIIGARQAALTMQILIRGVASVPARLEEFDAWTGQYRSFEIASAKEPACPCCAQRLFPFLDGVSGGKATRLCGRGAVQVTPAGRGEINLAALGQRLTPLGEVLATDLFVRSRFKAQDEASPIELTVFADGRALIKGTEDPARARISYARYVGQ